MFKQNYVLVATIIFIIAVATSSTQSAPTYQWKLEDTRGEYQIFTSNVPSKEFIAAKCVAVIPARMDVISLVLRDIPHFSEWMSDCKATKILKVGDDRADVFIFWFRQHVPFFTDRDMVLRSSVIINYQEGRSIIHSRSTNEMSYDANEGYVRMPSFYSEFLLEWIDQNHTRVTFWIDPDLGKGLPIGMSNATIKMIPYKSLEGLAKMVKLKQYIEAAKTSEARKMIDDAVKKGYIK